VECGEEEEVSQAEALKWGKFKKVVQTILMLNDKKNIKYYLRIAHALIVPNRKENGILKIYKK
jgi:hypothetical protein